VVLLAAGGQQSAIPPRHSVPRDYHIMIFQYLNQELILSLRKMLFGPENKFRLNMTK
jgi:hypothetical protein